MFCFFSLPAAPGIPKFCVTWYHQPSWGPSCACLAANTETGKGDAPQEILLFGSLQNIREKISAQMQSTQSNMTTFVTRPHEFSCGIVPPTRQPCGPGHLLRHGVELAGGVGEGGGPAGVRVLGRGQAGVVAEQPQRQPRRSPGAAPPCQRLQEVRRRAPRRAMNGMASPSQPPPNPSIVCVLERMGNVTTGGWLPPLTTGHAAWVPETKPRLDRPVSRCTKSNPLPLTSAQIRSFLGRAGVRFYCGPPGVFTC